jgi:adenylate cyclase
MSLRISPIAKMNISRIIPFGLIWLIFSIVYALLERGILGHLNYYPATGNPYSFSTTIIATPLTAFILGLLIGTIEIFFLSRLFPEINLISKIIIKTFFYLASIILFLLVLTLISNALALKTSMFDNTVWHNTWLFLSNFAFWGVEIYIAAIIGITLFYTEVSENLGQGVLNNFLTGKYHAPKEEERIFMFLDMKSSTTIAENMGHVKYFEMLKAYFSDMTNAIITCSGEIYQYVGDEIVVTWKLKNGLINNNCVECFYAIRQALDIQRGKYMEKFGLLPEFKAGYHYGRVITGEIGVAKKAIIFTGDVLNTAARIQSLCNTYRVDILISDVLIRKLDLRVGYQIQTFGDIELRGRDEKIELFTINKLYTFP